MDQRSPVFVGIDVAKDRLDVHVLPSGEAFAVTRDHAGLERLVTHLRQATPALVVLEATGGFEITVAAALSGARSLEVNRVGARWSAPHLAAVDQFDQPKCSRPAS
jgi:hypothetical protein